MPLYDCSKCPAYCCTYDERYTKMAGETAVLRHQKDPIYGKACMFLDLEKRRCTIYEARPGVCHEYPDQPRCGYYDFLKWERQQQGDPDFIPLQDRIG